MKTRKCIVIDEHTMTLIAENAKKISEKTGTFISKSSYVNKLVSNFAKQTNNLILKEFFKDVYDVEIYPELDQAREEISNLIQGE